MRSDIDHNTMPEVYTEWANTSGNLKTHVIQKWACALGVSRQKIYRQLKNYTSAGKARKTRGDKGQPEIHDLHTWALTLADIMAMAPERAGRRVTIETALRAGLQNGILTREAGDVPLSTYTRALRELGLTPRSKRCSRFESRAAMEQAQYDASGSEYLFVAKWHSNGEPVIKVRASKSYKNKEKHEELKVWYHSMVEDYSRYILARPYISQGESAADGLSFLKWCFARKEDKQIVFRGLPGRLYLDNGPLAKAESIAGFLQKISVKKKTHAPETARATGKVERQWRTLWQQFEMTFFLQADWEKAEYSLEEIRGLLTNYLVEFNRKKCRGKQETREAMWLDGVRKIGGVVDIAEAAFNTAFERLRCTVGGDGLLSINNVEYMVKGLVNRDVYVYRGVLDNERIVAEDVVTRERYECKPYDMPCLDEYRSTKKQPWELVKGQNDESRRQFEDRGFTQLYTSAAEGQNIICMPPRSREVREVEDKFRLDRFANLGAAMAEFTEIVGFSVEGAERSEIERLIVESGLSVEYTREFAQDARMRTASAAVRAEG